jgi:uncharacterized membrane protein
MKRLLLLSCSLGLALTPLYAKSYTVDQLAVEAQIQPDGRLNIRETIRYSFDGSFSFAFREIPMKAGEAIENIQVSEAGTSYKREPGGATGSFDVSTSGNTVKITWYYTAENEEKTFTLSYAVLGAVHRYPDTGELYYQFVGVGWDRPIGRVSALVRLPGRVPAGEIRAWAHGPLHGAVSLPGDGTVQFEVSPLPATTFWEGRILFPVTELAGIPLFSGEPAAERIRAEEAAWAEEANRKRQETIQNAERRSELISLLLPISILAALAGMGMWLFLWLRVGKAHPQNIRSVPGELPSDHPPALLSYLVYHTVGGTALVATLIDLARRGHLKIREEVRDKRVLFWTTEETDYRFDVTSEPDDRLAGFEQNLLDFMLGKAGDGSGFWMSEFKKVARKNRSSFLKWFKEWRKKVEELGKKEEFFEPYKLNILLGNIVCGLGIAAIGIAISIVTSSLTGAPAFIAGPLQVVLSTLLRRRTVEGQALLKGWLAFKEHIQSISKAMSPVSLTSHEWSRYIVASILFGLHKKLGKLLEISAGNNAAHMVPWYVGSTSGSPGEGISGLGAGISGMVTSVSSTMSSASGTGGGASGGGGGGSGGGGGGAG